MNDFKQLEVAHDFIQWLFPNHFKSRYNLNSVPLSVVEAKKFK